MALKDMDQFNEIMYQIKQNIYWYKNNHIESNRTRIFLSSGDSFNYNLSKESIAHLLGVKTDYLATCGHFKNKSSYLLLKELCQNQIRISGMIKDGKMSLNDIFSNRIKEKIENFKSNTSISLNKIAFVCKYDKQKAHFQGKTARNCDYIIFKIENDGTILELDIALNGKIAVPVSNRVYYDETEAIDSLKFLLEDQTICITSSIIFNNDFYVQNKKIFLSEAEKLLKLEILENYRLKYGAIIDVVGDCKYYYKLNQTNKKVVQDTYNVYEIIIDCITENKIIDKNRLYNLTEQNIALIDAINNTLVNNSASVEHQTAYSDLQKQIMSLTEANKALMQKNKELDNELTTTKKELNNEKLENEKSLVLVKNITDALNNYNNGGNYVK